MGKLLADKLANLVIFDGAIGTEIYRRNFFVNASFEQLSVTNPAVIMDIHKSYLDAGAEVLTTNSYNANARTLGKFGLGGEVEKINRAAVALARRAIVESGLDGKALVAASVGPVCNPESPDDRRSRAELLTGQIRALDEADFILFESLRNTVDLAAVLEAIKNFPGLEYVLSFAFDEHNKGATESIFHEYLRLISTAPGPKPAALGLNCGSGPEGMLSDLELLINMTDLPVIVQPSAGRPRQIDGRMIYMTSAEYFVTYAQRYVTLGAAGVGGCCGITPGHISELVRTIRPLALAERRKLPELQISECELKTPKPLAERSALGRKLAAGEFVRTVEITPPRGTDFTATLAGARMCKEFGIDAVNLPDGPRASARISSLATAITIQQSVGIETVLHCCCRDRSMIGLQAELLGCSGMGINNLLFITGDPPKLGDYPFSSGVFDVDSIGLITMQDRLNRGVDMAGKMLETQTSAVICAGADPCSIDLEREYRRIREKVAAGAEVIITQPVFSLEPLFALLDQISTLDVRVIAGIWPLTSLRNAEFMRNEVPGVVVPDEVMRRMAAAGSREEQLAEGVRIARESVAGIRERVSGVQVSAPFGKVSIALDVLKD